MSESGFLSSKQSLQSEYEELSHLLNSFKSFEMRSVSNDNIKYFINNFFESYSLRKKYLKNNCDKYIFIHLQKDNFDFKDIDKFLLAEVSNSIGIEFTNLTSLANYLETQDQYLTMLFSTNNEYSLRFLLSYSYLLRNKFIIILGSVSNANYFDKSLQLNFSDAFINFYIGNILEKIGTNITELKIDINEVKGDIYYISQILHEILTQKTYNEVPSEIVSLEPINLDLNDTKEIQRNNLEIPEQIRERTEIIAPESAKKDIRHYNSKDEIQNDISGIPDANNITNSLNLTARENAIYETLVKESFISRPQLAEIVWGDEGKNAKDDAIDQVISRLRRKFVKAGYSKDYIFSKKGEGVGIVFNSVN